MMRAIMGIWSPCETVGIAAAVHAFVVQFDAGEHVLQLRDGTHDVGALHGMLLHDVEFFVGQRAGLLEHAVVHADLADVVQQRGDAQAVEIFGGEAEGFADEEEYLATRSEWPRV